MYTQNGRTVSLQRSGALKRGAQQSQHDRITLSFALAEQVNSWLALILAESNIHVGFRRSMIHQSVAGMEIMHQLNEGVLYASREAL